MESIDSKIEVVKIANSSGLELEVINYGATIKSLRVPNKYDSKTSVVIGLKQPQHYTQFPYINYPLFFGSSIGRYAGRISEGNFRIDEKEYSIKSEAGVHLHGGTKGFDKKIWKINNVYEGASSSVKLSYFSKDLEEGYPGDLEVSVIYEVHKSNALRITYEAVTSKKTHVNLTNHAYFNLNGQGSILDHFMKLNNLSHLEVDHRLLPTGKLLRSKETRFDFKVKSLIGRQDFLGFDDTFVLDKTKAKAAMLFSKKTGIKMEVFTNQPAWLFTRLKNFLTYH